MNQARHLSPVSSSNPLAVLESIGAQTVSEFIEESQPKRHQKMVTITRNPGVQLFRAESEPDVVLPEPNDSPMDEAAPVENAAPQVPAKTTESDALMQSTIESAMQIQQLAKRLKANEDSLLQRKSDLKRKMEAWDQSVARQQKDFETRLSQLEQRASHVRCQHLHVMQLQTDIVKSYETSKAAIELLVTESGSDHQTVSALRTLKHEICGRFDYISRRWEHLAKLMQRQRDEDIAVRSVDDSVDWTV